MIGTLLLVLAIVPYLYNEPDSVVFDLPSTEFGQDAMCAHFERLGDTKWRTEGGADLAAQVWNDNDDDYVERLVHVSAGADITEDKATDLFYTLEDACPHLEPVG